MSQPLACRLTAELDRISLVDPHSHINPHAAASKNFADLLGYHYYTELVHSAGLPRERIEEQNLSPREKVARIVEWLPAIENTVQYGWLIEMCREFFDFRDPTITVKNWEALYATAELRMSQADWEDQILTRSQLDAVFLTNDFDDPLTGFDTNRFIPCLRTDELVFHLPSPGVRERLAATTGIDPSNPGALRRALGALFSRFTEAGARACAVSLPPDFSPMPVGSGTIEPILRSLAAGDSPGPDERRALSYFVFWSLAEFCAEFELPFDLMIGVNRRVYENGVHQGQDLFDARCSLIQYRSLFNAFPGVTFPVSVLSHNMNQELVSHSWIFPNVVTNGHWWYSNIPAYIEHDCRTRLQAVPRTKQIGYYSDMYKLEFGLPKFGMYRRILGKILAEDFVIGMGWTEERALELGRYVLRDNVDRVFPRRR
jgi:glucuronate isomerase